MGKPASPLAWRVAEMLQQADLDEAVIREIAGLIGAAEDARDNARAATDEAFRAELQERRREQAKPATTWGQYIENYDD